MAIISLIAYSFLACHILTSSAFKTIVPKLNNMFAIVYCRIQVLLYKGWFYEIQLGDKRFEGLICDMLKTSML